MRIVLFSLFVLVVSSCKTPEQADTAPQTSPTPSAPSSYALHVLLTSDEHGWLAPLHDKKEGVLRGGVHAVATAMAHEGYQKGAPSWLLMSAGDMWTGPYETTVLEGAPMTAFMSHVGYAAAAIGNHEFDFGQRAAEARARNATFPFIAANLVKAGTTEQPAWIKPYTIVEVPVEGGVVRAALIGLACVDTPYTSDVRNLVGVEFQPYDKTLARVLPLVKNTEKPDVIIVVAHDAISALKPLAPLLREHGVNLVAAGHEHRPGLIVDDNGTSAQGDDVVFCNAGPYLRTFCKVDLTYQGNALTAYATKHVEVKTPAGAPTAPFDATLKNIVEQAEASAERIGGEVLVTTSDRFTRGRDGSLGPFIVDAWLEALPYAQVAITNAGGLRQDIEAGELRIRDIVSALPFNNYLLIVDVTGKELKELLGNPESVVGGVTYRYKSETSGARVVTSVQKRDGTLVTDDERFKVVINDFMYRGGDRYVFSDREPEETAIDWRDPVFRALRAAAAKGGTITPATSARATPE